MLLPLVFWLAQRVLPPMHVSLPGIQLIVSFPNTHFAGES